MPTTTQVLDGVDLSGRVAVVTGATGGIGLAVARALAAHHADVIVAGRCAEKGRAALAELAAAGGRGRREFVQLDLADPGSVGAAADRLLALAPRLSLLINNAGVMGTPLTRTAQGWELQLATNHLGHFALTCRLVPALLRGAPARVVNVTSGGPVLTPFRFQDPHFDRDPYDKFEAYASSKSAGVLHAIGLDARLSARGLRAFAANPGLTATGLGRHLSRDDVRTLLRRAAAGRRGVPPARPPDEGAATVVWAATSAALDGPAGVYCGDCAIEPLPAELVADEAAARLWELSARLTGETVPR